MGKKEISKFGDVENKKGKFHSSENKLPIYDV